MSHDVGCGIWNCYIYRLVISCNKNIWLFLRIETQSSEAQGKEVEIFERILFPVTSSMGSNELRLRRPVDRSEPEFI